MFDSLLAVAQGVVHDVEATENSAFLLTIALRSQG